MNQFGLSPEQLQNMENELGEYVEQMGEDLPSSIDELEDGGAPAIDLPKLFGEGGNLTQKANKNSESHNKDKKKKTTRQHDNMTTSYF